jgi:hypothetical protein
LAELEPDDELELALEPLVPASNSWRLSDPSWFASSLPKSSFELAEAELPPDVPPEAADLLLCFIAESHSERLSLPSWFVSALLKSSDWLAAAELELPVAEDLLFAVSFA